MKTRFHFLFFILLIFYSSKNYGQHAMFLHQGNISYTKSVNAYAIMKERFSDDDDPWSQAFLDALKKSGSQFKTTQFNLAFKDDKTLYTPVISDVPQTGFSDFTSVANTNIIFSDLSKQQSVAQKDIFGDKFLLTDSLRKIHWKITSELRDIAGFHCRRANALIMDSVYVVAFYTDQITTSGGPESFTGLPGMILQLALPHEHLIWTATKISVNPEVVDADLTAPTKGKPMNNKQYYDKILPSVKDWGKTGSLILQNAML